MRGRPPLLVRRVGGFEINLAVDERTLLRSIPARIGSMLSALGDPEAPVPDELRRLFPVVFATDPQAQAAYDRKARAELVGHHRRALEVLSETATATHLNDAEAEQWLVALNDLRLVLGSALDVSEEPVELDEDDPNYGDWLCYQYLTFLESEVVDAMAAELPAPTPGADDSAPDDPWGDPPGGLRWDGTPLPNDG